MIPPHRVMGAGAGVVAATRFGLATLAPVKESLATRVWRAADAMSTDNAVVPRVAGDTYACLHLVMHVAEPIAT